MELIKLYRKLLIFCRPWWKYCIGGAVFTMAMAMLQLPAPLLTKYIFDNVFTQRNFEILNVIIIGLFVLMITQNISSGITSFFLFKFRSNVVLEIKHKLFEHIENLSMEYHTNKQIGYLSTRLMSDAERLQGMMADTIISFVRDIVTFMIGISALFFLNWHLAMISISILPFFIYSMYFFSGKIRKGVREVQEKNIVVANIFFETLYSILIIKSFCLEKIQSNKVKEKLANLLNANFSLMKVSLASNFIISSIGGLAPIFILWYGGHEIMTGHLTIGSYFAFNMFLGYLYGPANRIVGLNATVQESLVSLKRIYEIFDIPQEDFNIIKSVPLRIKNKTIRYENITFSYNGDGRMPIIKDCNLNISRNEKIALVGKTGAGKSTLLYLLLKLYKPQNGNIFIDETNIQQIKYCEIRKNIGFAPQNPLVFGGSIKSNIIIGNIHASEKDIMNAIRISGLTNLIKDLPKGLETEIGDRGMKLSGGERQRISIARVIVKDPPIVLLDEATSDIDSDTEKEIYDNLKKLIQDKTVIYVAHRLFSVLHADRIAFINNGQVVAVGTHNHLYNQLIDYRRIYDEQFYSGSH